MRKCLGQIRLLRDFMPKTKNKILPVHHKICPLSGKVAVGSYCYMFNVYTSSLYNIITIHNEIMISFKIFISQAMPSGSASVNIII